MNQIATGMFIARKRRELNLTQAQLAERLGISSKSVSKWERGKCMPDYGIVNELCDALGITVSELLDGEENERESLRVYDNGQMIEMLARIQRLESQRITIIAIALTLFVYFIEILIDNVCARLNWKQVLDVCWLITLLAGGINILILMSIR